MSLLLRKLRLEEKEFVTSKELGAYCKSLKLDYNTVVRYFSGRGYIIRIFRGVFYVKSLVEFELGRSKYNHLQLVAKGLELKNVRNWYFGLHTALKLNNMTHEHFAVEDVVSDSLFRANPMTIAGYKFKFIKLSSPLLQFGVTRERGGIRYSDPEKTVLDFIYLWRYGGLPQAKIITDATPWTKNASKTKLKSYARQYPKTVRALMEQLTR